MTVSLPVPLIEPHDLPVPHIAGVLRSVTAPDILQNAGAALTDALQSIVLQSNVHHLSGTIRLSWYATIHNATDYYQRRTNQVDGQAFVGVGDQALIQITPPVQDTLTHPTTTFYFRRGRAVVRIIGYGHPDPTFAEVLTRAGVLAYAHRLDQRLVYLHQ